METTDTTPAAETGTGAGAAPAAAAGSAARGRSRWARRSGRRAPAPGTHHWRRDLVELAASSQPSRWRTPSPRPW
ncbi:hypothetical protein ACFQVA_03565 [Actinomadura keratinilytica]